MKTGSEYANWEQYGSEKGSGNPLIGMLIQKTGLEDYLNQAGMSGISGTLSALKPIAPPKPVASMQAVPPAMTPAMPPAMMPMSNVQITPIPDQSVLTPDDYQIGLSILRGK